MKEKYVRFTDVMRSTWPYLDAFCDSGTVVHFVKKYSPADSEDEAAVHAYCEDLMMVIQGAYEEGCKAIFQVLKDKGAVKYENEH